MLYGRGRDMGIQEDLSGRLASLLMAAQESCNSAEMKLTLAGALSVNLPQTSHGLIWRLQCAQVLRTTQSLAKDIELLQALQGDVDDLFR